MSLKGIVAIRNRGANTPTKQIEDVFSKLEIKGVIVDVDGNDPAIRFEAIHDPESSSIYFDWFIGLGIGLIVVIDLFHLVFGR